MPRRSPCSRRASASVPTTRRSPIRSALALEILGGDEVGPPAFEGYLRPGPDDELALASPAGCWPASTGRSEALRGSSGRAVAVNPGDSDYRLALAQGLFPGRPTGREASRPAARRSGSTPTCSMPGALLVESYRRAGDREKADAEFRTMVRFYPASREIWQQWYERLRSSG